MCVARYASHYFSKGAICVPLDDQEKNICTLSSHRATRELYAKVPSHRAPVGAVCEGSMRIELRSELYAKGALCGSTELYAALQWSSNFFLFEPRQNKTCLQEFPTRPDTNRPAQPQKLASVFKFRL